MPDMIKIVRCRAERRDALVAFVAAHNNAPEHHIGYFGLSPEDIRLALQMLNLPLHRGTRLALDGGRIVGVLALDVDREIGRAWLYGPLLDIVDDALWQATADALYAAAVPSLPAGIREHEMFVDTRNARARAFAARHGFPTIGEWAVYNLPAGQLAALPAAEAQPWDDRYLASLEALHKRLFPNSSYTTSYMRQEWAERGAILLVAAEGEALHGYFFGRVEIEAGEAYVDLVGVAEDQRRTGLGRRLMLAGLDRMKGAPGLRQVNLTVASGNAPALRLYDSLGFTRERDMIAFRRLVAHGDSP